MPAPWLFLRLSLSLSLRLPFPVLPLLYSCIVLFLAREQAGHCGGTRGAEARVSGRGEAGCALPLLPSGTRAVCGCCPADRLRGAVFGLLLGARAKDEAARCRGAGVTAFDLGVRPCPVQKGPGQRQRCPRAFPQRPAFPRTCKQKARRRGAFQKLPWRVGRALPSRTSPACPRGQVRRRGASAEAGGTVGAPAARARADQTPGRGARPGPLMQARGGGRGQSCAANTGRVRLSASPSVHSTSSSMRMPP